MTRSLSVRPFEGTSVDESVGKGTRGVDGATDGNTGNFVSLRVTVWARVPEELGRAEVGLRAGVQGSRRSSEEAGPGSNFERTPLKSLRMPLREVLESQARSSVLVS